ncbi:hypothetical protein HYH03_000549 [Edaphochlamys debaryana]|uniref:Arabinanase/levansucrase/invertase n=1 Tax=Edaphochlamys debaryana TaxID=47281 RepID=A0A835YP82_9CHLO|nr:hypothetical protein HYH03_000549 [Edaphochlamys debaryana]|eukprot:KAG2502055.1 hypothetical protein HYH03_000549 [Edaphochlamys debaryana]
MLGLRQPGACRHQAGAWGPAGAAWRAHPARRAPNPATCRPETRTLLPSPYAASGSPRTSSSIAAASTSAEAAPVSKQGQVFSLGEPGSWDEAAVGSPVVRCYLGDDEQRWVMWYSGRKADSPAGANGGVDAVAPSSGSVGVAISRDGVHWFRGTDAIEGSRGPDAASDVGQTITPNGDWWWFDTCHLAPGDVQVLSNSSVSSGVGVYWMFYAGGDYEPVQLPEGFPGAGAEAVEGMRTRPGLAMSQDGRNWARIEADHHTGALFDVGKPGEPDSLFVRSPQVMNVGPGDMRMFYTSWCPSRRRWVVLSATSPDGFRWTKRGIVFDPAAVGAASGTSSVDLAAASGSSVDMGSAASGNGGAAAFDAQGAAAISVVRDIDNRQYLMFYEAVGADNRRTVGLAVSKDCSNWRRYGSPVLAAAGEDEGAGEAWDGGDVGSPCGVSMTARKWRIYYAGRSTSGSGPWQGIGLAVSVEGGPTFEGVPVEYRRRAPATAAAVTAAFTAEGGLSDLE